MSEAQLHTQQSPPQKFSRYRSVRQANPTKQISFAPPPSQATPSSEALNVGPSQSRYHRPVKSAVGIAPQHPEHLPRPGRIVHSHSASLAALTGERSPHSSQNAGPVSPRRAGTLSRQHPLATHLQTPLSSSHASSQQAATQRSAPAGSTPRPYNDGSLIGSPQRLAHPDARAIVNAEDERLRRMKAQQNATREFERSRRPAGEEETKRKRAEEARARALQADQPRIASIIASQAPRSSQIGVATRRNCGPSIKKAANGNAPTSHPQMATSVPEALDIVPRPQSPCTGQPSLLRKLTTRQKPSISSQTQQQLPFETVAEQSASSMPPVQQPGSPPMQPMASPPPRSPSPVHPTFDAPISAVNAGERRVLVRCGASSITLPVTPATTAGDLVNSASTCMSETINPRQSILIETFAQLGLERRLRQYEHVRDVLNSWDHDEQNALEIASESANEEVPDDLGAKHVPKQQPGETTVYMYHSLKPGKWDKKWVTLRSDGQISVAKHNDGKDGSNICHLSDFDIYKPTQPQMKKVKSPKKVCYAIKSQQKSAMFLSGLNFVHFFSTGDKETGERLYSAVQAWRSWYLVNTLGEGQQQTNSHLTNGDRPGTSDTDTEYQLGSFKPFLDFDLGELSMDHSATANHRRNPSARDRVAPPSSFPAWLNNDTAAAAAFIGGSAPTRGRAPSITRIGERTGSIRSNTEPPSEMRRGGTLKRSGSVCRTRQQPKPLIDLIPELKEQPRHVRKGRDIALAPGKQLVDVATEVENTPGAVVPPPARPWRRPEAGETNPKREGRGHSISNDEDAFTGSGLLGRSFSKRAQGGSGHGHGVQTGDRDMIGKPMLDLHLHSQFADGSLLWQVEAYKGEDERGLVVDREKRVEGSVKTGEGL